VQLSRSVIATTPVFVWHRGSCSTGPPNGTLHTPRLEADGFILVSNLAIRGVANWFCAHCRETREKMGGILK
jgi:hypothetical protein